MAFKSISAQISLEFKILSSADLFLQQAAGNAILRRSIRQVADIARLDDPVHDTAFGNIEFKEIRLIDARR